MSLSRRDFPMRQATGGAYHFGAGQGSGSLTDSIAAERKVSLANFFSDHVDT
jgi:hypothetical protein